MFSNSKLLKYAARAVLALMVFVSIVLTVNASNCVCVIDKPLNTTEEPKKLVLETESCIQEEKPMEINHSEPPEKEIIELVEIKEETHKATDGTEYIYYEVYDETDGNWYSMEEWLQEYTYDLCVEYEITEYYTLILAQLYHESGYTYDAISKSNDYGIAQINICNHKSLEEKLGITDFLDPEQSILCCIYLMSSNLKNYGVESGLSCYNTGKPYETTPYARTVMSIWYNNMRIKE